MDKRRLIIIAFFLVLIFTSCGQTESIDPETIGNVEQGHILFEDPSRGRCTSCHTQDGSDVPTGPSLVGIANIAGKRIPGLSAVEYLEQSILDPSAYIVEGYQDRMKAYRIVVPEEVDYMFADMLTEKDLNNLVAYLLTQ
jgi:cytochrome c2